MMKITIKSIARIANCSERTVEAILQNRRTDTKNISEIKKDLEEAAFLAETNVAQKYRAGDLKKS